MSDREFKIIHLKKFSKLQENTGRQMNRVIKTIYKFNEEFNKEIKTIKKSKS